MLAVEKVVPHIAGTGLLVEVFVVRRTAEGIRVLHVLGDVEGQHCIVVDDMVDTAGTLCLAAQALKDEGAARKRFSGIFE